MDSLTPLYFLRVPLQVTKTQIRGLSASKTVPFQLNLSESFVREFVEVSEDTLLVLLRLFCELFAREWFEVGMGRAPAEQECEVWTIKEISLRYFAVLIEHVPYSIEIFL